VATGAPSQLTDDVVLRVAWAIGLMPAAAPFILAVRACSWLGTRRDDAPAGWASGLFLVSVLLIGITSAIRGKH